MPGLIRGVARTAVVPGTATAVSGRVSRRQQSRWAEQDQAQYAEAPAQAAPAASPVEQLKLGSYVTPVSSPRRSSRRRRRSCSGNERYAEGNISHSG